MKKKLTELMEKEGFILLLFLCVCVVAGGTLFISKRNLNATNAKLGSDNFTIVDDDPGKTTSYDEDLELSMLADKEMEASSSDEDSEELVEESPEDVIEVLLPEDDYSEDDMEELEFEDEEEEADSNFVVKDLSFILPLDGSIITEYTTDSLVYSETLESWVGHGAIDIGGKEGDNIKAAADGIVKEVYEDQLWGIVIVIEHNEELQTRYSNLATKDMVTVGTQVRKGDHISKVGKTGKIEMLMEPHIHFEVIKNGKIVDPRSIMD
ncbi:M23 family metallopeptidase [Tissierella sp.]|uniref:M23 family metallopeptidase n=1 Tax=Tissierella sp. TaxID=41274 RepID=UPI00285D166C|nr:M23 family metallopeptidase [Tissierella sp.]MDR7856937.1 M23 family metallopeptidase [Tissierella sp.]